MIKPLPFNELNPMSNCRNCDNPLQPQYKYCYHCGQSVINFVKPVKPALKDMLHETLDIDGRLFTTVKTLLLKPGLLSLAYCDGKRVTYTQTLRMYLVISILFFLMMTMLESYASPDNAESSALNGYYPKLMFVLLPVFTLILQLLFRGTFYLSNLIFAIHIHCFVYLVYILSLPFHILDLWPLPNSVMMVLSVMAAPIFFYLCGYLLLAMKRFYREHWAKILLKMALFLPAYLIVLSVGLDVMMGMGLS